MSSSPRQLKPRTDYRRFMYEKTSIFDVTTMPDKRCQRRLSHSKVGLAGNSPTFVHISKNERFGELRKHQERLDEMRRKGDLEGLFNAWVKTEDYPFTNQEMKQTRLAIIKLLKKRLLVARSDGRDYEEFKEVLDDTKDKMIMMRIRLSVHAFIARAEQHARRLQHVDSGSDSEENSDEDEDSDFGSPATTATKATTAPASPSPAAPTTPREKSKSQDKSATMPAPATAGKAAAKAGEATTEDEASDADSAGAGSASDAPPPKAAGGGAGAKKPARDDDAEEMTY